MSSTAPQPSDAMAARAAAVPSCARPSHTKSSTDLHSVTAVSKRAMASSGEPTMRLCLPAHTVRRAASCLQALRDCCDDAAVADAKTGAWSLANVGEPLNSRHVSGWRQLGACAAAVGGDDDDGRMAVSAGVRCMASARSCLAAASASAIKSL